MAEKPYRVIIEGEDGGGAQVFEAESPEEMMGQFKQSATHATQKIREQAQEIAQLRQLAMQAQSNGNGQHQIVDRDQEIQELFSEGPRKMIRREALQGICEELGVGSLREVVQDYAQVRQSATLASVKNAASTFVERHPEWDALSEEQKIKDGTVLGQIVEQYGLIGDNQDSLDLAYKIGMGGGQFKYLRGTVDEPPNYHNGPLPTTVTRPSSQPNTSESEQEFYRTAKSAEDIRKYIEKKHGVR